MAAPPKNIIEMAAHPSLKRGVNENLSLGRRKSEIVGRFTFARNPRSQVLMGSLALQKLMRGLIDKSENIAGILAEPIGFTAHT